MKQLIWVSLLLIICCGFGAHSFGHPPEGYDCNNAAENVLTGQGTKDDPFVLMSSKPFEVNRSNLLLIRPLCYGTRY